MNHPTINVLVIANLATGRHHQSYDHWFHHTTTSARQRAIRMRRRDDPAP